MADFLGPAPPGEDRLIRDLVYRAQLADESPGQATTSITLDPSLRPGATEGARTYHLDLATGAVVVRELWDGEETARQQRTLSGMRWPCPPLLPDPRPPLDPLQPVLRSLDGTAPLDVDGVRARVLRMVERELSLSGIVKPRLVLVCESHVEDLVLPEGSSTEVHCATFVHAGSRPEVRQRLLVLPEEPGARVYAAISDAQGSAWVAERPFHILPGNLGSRGPWSLTRYSGFQRGFPGWSHSGTPLPLRPAQPPVRASLGCHLLALPPDWSVPRTATEASTVAGALAEPVVIRGGLDGVLVIVVRGRSIERFHMIGDPRVGIDDLIRAIAASGDEPDAIALVRVDLFDDDGQLRRAVVTLAEADGQRAQRVCALDYDASSDEPARDRLVFMAPEVVETNGWLGVPPEAEVELVIPTTAEA